MLIKQIIEFELWGLGPPGCTCTPKPGYSNKKIKTSMENLRMDHYLRPKYCGRQYTLLPPTCAKLLTKFNPEMRDFKRVLDLNRK